MKKRTEKKQPKAVIEYLAALGRKGGPARAKALTPAKRRAIARKAAQTRWRKEKKEP